MKAPIDFYFDFISPYGYLAATQVDRVASDHGREVRWHPFLLGITVLKVMGLKPLMETPLKGEYTRLDKPRMASLLGVPLASPDMKAASSVAAARAFYWLHDQDPGKAVALARRLLERLWVRGESLSEAEVVAQEASALGVDRDTLLAALASPPVKERLRVAVDRAIERGVFGSPTFIVDGQPIWGVDRLWMLEHWLKHGHWQPAGSPSGEP